jgi:hypothetical protein
VPERQEFGQPAERPGVVVVVVVMVVVPGLWLVARGRGGVIMTVIVIMRVIGVIVVRVRVMAHGGGSLSAV